MTDLFDQDREALGLLIREGRAPLGPRGVPVSSAIRLEMFGLAEIEGDPQWAEVTPQGRALARGAGA